MQHVVQGKTDGVAWFKAGRYLEVERDEEGFRDWKMPLM
jgi:hypothetical protein